VEDFGDVKKTNDVAILVAHRLAVVSRENRKQD
jgi:hypothetical protein